MPFRPVKPFLLPLAATLLLPAPALASESRAGDVAERLNDPITQYAVAGMLSVLAKTILDLRIEPLARAAGEMGDDRARDLPPDARLGDLVGPEADQVPDEIVARVPGMMRSMGTMAGAIDEMLPELEALARRMRDTVPTR